MAFGRRGLDSEGSRRAEASLGSLEAGGLPLAAQERLANLSAGGGAFTSDLSTAEFLLLRQAGFRPLAQVMGSCFYRIGWQYMPGERAPGSYVPEGQMTPTGAYEYDSLGRRVYSGASFGQVFELDVETQAWQEARRLALGRLGQEATLVGADAVVGVKLRRGSYDWGRNMIEFVAIGTAVASERYELGKQPLLSNLSGEEFAKLYAGGYLPLGIVAGSAVIYVITGWQQRRAGRLFAGNQELVDYTQGTQHARKVALSRVTGEARALDAAGLVGLKLEVSPREQEHEGSRSRQKDMIVTVHALGTAITAIERPEAPLPVGLSLLLNEPPP